MNRISRFWICMLAASLLTLGGSCTDTPPDTPPDAAESQTIQIAYTEWASSVASANLVKAVFQEKLGIRCDLVSMSADRMWEAVAEGEVDAMLSAWLPDTHGHYMEKFGGRVVDLGANLEGTRTGLVVPEVKIGRLAAGTGIHKSYITIDSITEMPANAEKFNYRLIGIEPEAGIMRQTENAMETYGLGNFELIKSSESEMIDALARAIREQRWIVVTGWIPHWSFARWNLKFLEDPENIFGGEGRIHTIARIGLKDDMPEALRLLDNFRWEPEDVEQLMLWIEDDKGRFPYDKALRWVRANPDKVDAWMPKKDS